MSTAATTEKRPDRTTMQGMVWNANHVLDRALDPKTNGVPTVLFEKAKGIALISVVEVGFIFSGNVGTGLLMAKKSDGSWSTPSAIGLSGVGWGFIVGGSIKDVMVFIMDDATMQTMAGDAGIKFGGQAELTLGPFGRSADASIALSNKGAGGTVSVSFTQGAFAGVSIEGAVTAPRSAVNELYYKTSATPSQIIFEDAAKVPEDSLIPDIYAKLNKLASGETGVPTEEEKKKAKAALEEAIKAAEEAKKSADVEHVDAKKMAEKE